MLKTYQFNLTKQINILILIMVNELKSTFNNLGKEFLNDNVYEYCIIMN